MPLKICNKCCKEKDTSLFYANKRMKDGVNTFCIECHKADNIARKIKNRANSDLKAKELAWKKEYRDRTQQQRAAYMLEWREKNKEHVASYSKSYREQNKERFAYLCQKRKIALMRRTPKWLTEDDYWVISEAYALAMLRTVATGVKHHVDHILPLRGKNVSGLHVPQNLQVIPWLDNQRKTNKYEVSLC